MPHKNFLVIMWKMRKITEQTLDEAVILTYISQEEADTIKLIPQIPQV
jgi:hypothetical protein